MAQTIKEYRYYLLDSITSPAETINARSLFEAAGLILGIEKPTPIREVKDFTVFTDGDLEVMLRRLN